MSTMAITRLFHIQCWSPPKGLNVGGVLVALIATVMLLASCATIVGSPTQPITINSVPGSAKVVVTDEKNVVAFQGETPASVTLKKSDGSYFGGKTFKVEISKEGYQTQVVVVDSSPNGWYIAGNLIFGGIIGWLIVDPFNGGMYTLSPDKVNASLGGGSMSHFQWQEGSLAILLLEDVPSSLRDKMVKVSSK
jgi:hypothetical protein